MNIETCNICNCEEKKTKSFIKWGYKAVGIWICDDCHTKNQNERRIKLLTEAKNKSPFSCIDETSVVCPHCYTTQNIDGGYWEEDANLFCEDCGGSYRLEVVEEPLYSTYVTGKRVTLESTLEQINTKKVKQY